MPEGVETVVGHGETWAEAIDDVEWADGDVLVVGSSSIGPVARVFLGSRASKIVRVSPVPVVVVPREDLDRSHRPWAMRLRQREPAWPGSRALTPLALHRALTRGAADRFEVGFASVMPSLR